MIDWDSPSWGMDGQNVHMAENGSYWSQADIDRGCEE